MKKISSICLMLIAFMEGVFYPSYNLIIGNYFGNWRSAASNRFVYLIRISDKHDYAVEVWSVYFIAVWVILCLTIACVICSIMQKQKVLLTCQIAELVLFVTMMVVNNYAHISFGVESTGLDIVEYLKNAYLNLITELIAPVCIIVAILLDRLQKNKQRELESN